MNLYHFLFGFQLEKRFGTTQSADSLPLALYLVCGPSPKSFGDPPLPQTLRADAGYHIIHRVSAEAFRQGRDVHRDVFKAEGAAAAFAVEMRMQVLVIPRVRAAAQLIPHALRPVLDDVYQAACPEQGQGARYHRLIYRLQRIPDFRHREGMVRSAHCAHNQYSGCSGFDARFPK